MMTREHRQEAFSRAYVHAVAAQAGVLCSKPDPDYGIDLSLREVEVRGRRLWDTGVQVDLQLKSTTRASITATEVTHDLEVAAYNNLRVVPKGAPRILVLVVLPDNEEEWLNQSASELCMRRCAYWTSLEGAPETTAKVTRRITIATTNVFSADAITNLLERAKNRSRP
jgi:hypothetical protein